MVRTSVICKGGNLRPCAAACGPAPPAAANGKLAAPTVAEDHLTHSRRFMGDLSSVLSWGRALGNKVKLYHGLGATATIAKSANYSCSQFSTRKPGTFRKS